MIAMTADAQDARTSRSSAIQSPARFRDHGERHADWLTRATLWVQISREVTRLKTGARRSWTPLIAVGVVVWGFSCASAAASVCASLRYRIAGAGAKATAACQARAASSGEQVDATCLARARDRVAQKWAKAALRGDCPTTADAAAAQGAIDAFLEQLVAVLEPPTVSYCCRTGSSCFAGPVIDASTCLELSGTLGPPGSVCEGSTGSCVAPPGTGGPCCALPQFSVCTAGPTVAPAECVMGGGFDVPNAVCLPNGACVFP
jgi:hypothetical protein